MQYVLAGLIVSSAFVLGGCAAIIPVTQAGAAAIAAHGGAAAVAHGLGVDAMPRRNRVHGFFPKTIIGPKASVAFFVGHIGKAR